SRPDWASPLTPSISRHAPSPSRFEADASATCPSQAVWRQTRSSGAEARFARVGCQSEPSGRMAREEGAVASPGKVVRRQPVAVLRVGFVAEGVPLNNRLSAEVTVRGAFPIAEPICVVAEAKHRHLRSRTKADPLCHF